MSNYRIDEDKVEGKRLGRHVNHDPRSLRYTVGAPARTIVSVEHERVIPVLDQGDLGSCTGNASVGALGTKPLYDSLPSQDQPILDEDLAVLVYKKATQIDPYDGEYPPDDTGSDGLSVAKVCKAYGLTSGYTHATSLAAMQAALQDTPVIVGVNWYSGFDSPDSNGLVKLSGSVRGGHEFEVVGLDMDKQLFHAVNSWGTGWGKQGHFWFSFADMTRLLKEDGDCTQLLPLNVPAPTPTPGPGANFPVAADLVARIDKVARRAALSDAEWLDHRLRSYFHL